VFETEDSDLSVKVYWTKRLGVSALPVYAPWYVTKPTRSVPARFSHPPHGRGRLSGMSQTLLVLASTAGRPSGW